MRFPPGRKGKQVPVRIGVYGKGVGKWSLREAKEEWDRIRAWSRENNKDPRELKKEEQQDQVQQSSGPTFAEACASYLRNAKTKASQKEYPNLLNNQVIPLRSRYFREGSSFSVFECPAKEVGRIKSTWSLATGRLSPNSVMGYCLNVTGRQRSEGTAP